MKSFKKWMGDTTTSVMRNRGWIRTSEHYRIVGELHGKVEAERSSRNAFAEYAAAQIENATKERARGQAFPERRLIIGVPDLQIERVVDRRELYRIQLTLTDEDMQLGFAAGDERTLGYFCELIARRIFYQLRNEVRVFRKVRG